MSAWFVWGTLGLYPLTGTDKYFLGSPAIDNAILHFENGNYDVFSLKDCIDLTIIIMFSPTRQSFEDHSHEQRQTEYNG